ncbi:hypothetical protein [Nocardia sp. CA-290969]|uniref:hypothetical protein n=1 Tax=Nocardia sp. CA-290969 TaxID=3239986 RepID=UPI003D8D15A3
MLQADIDQIHALAGKLRGAGDRIDAIDVRTKAKELPAALPESPGEAAVSGISQALEQAAEFVEGAYLRAADRFRLVATTCSQCADSMETTDTEFSGKLSAMDVQSA